MKIILTLLLVVISTIAVAQTYKYRSYEDGIAMWDKNTQNWKFVLAAPNKTDIVMKGNKLIIYGPETHMYTIKDKNINVNENHEGTTYEMTKVYDSKNKQHSLRITKMKGSPVIVIAILQTNAGAWYRTTMVNP